MNKRKSVDTLVKEGGEGADTFVKEGADGFVRDAVGKHCGSQEVKGVRPKYKLHSSCDETRTGGGIRVTVDDEEEPATEEPATEEVATEEGPDEEVDAEEVAAEEVATEANRCNEDCASDFVLMFFFGAELAFVSFT